MKIYIFDKRKRFFFVLGHSIEEIRGHELFLSDPKPVINYNGLFGKIVDFIDFKIS